MKRFFTTTLMILLSFEVSFGQTAVMKLTPGKSSRTDAERLLGRPVTTVSQTLFEYRPKEAGRKLYIQYAQQSELIDRVEIMFDDPVARSTVGGLMGLPQKPDTTKWDSKGRLEEYFGSTALLVLIHQGPNASSPVIRIGYYSRELFAVALQKPTGTPMKDQPPQLSTTSAKAAGNKTSLMTFEKVDLLVPKGNKVQEKSVRLLFDGNSLIIDADKGETIYKTFPYTSIVSAEYSYSTKPRWKTAIGAAVLIGVFALPIFFMKSKQHWLTIRTAEDFAVLHLDKDNYRVILPTVETSTGKKVETVGDEK